MFHFAKGLHPQSALRQALHVPTSDKVRLNSQYFLLDAASFAEVYGEKIGIESSDACIEELSYNPQTTIVPATLVFANRELRRQCIDRIFYGEAFTQAQSGVYSLNAKAESFHFELVSTPARFFNTLEFHEDRVTKHCQDVHKGQAEWDFLRTLPVKVKGFFPNVYSADHDGGEFRYSLQKLPFFDLGTFVRHNSLVKKDWQSIFAQLNCFLHLTPKQACSPSDYRHHLRALAVDKLRTRIEAFLRMPESKHWLQAFATQTGDSFTAQVRDLQSELQERIATIAKEQLLFSHGDWCLSNMLYDANNLRLYFVDPRGSFMDSSPYAPIEYDLAKLSQSLWGGYDLMGTELKGEVILQDGQRELDQCLQRWQVDAELIALLEASLFWSLLPLHRGENERLLDYMIAGNQAFLRGRQCP